MPFGKRGTQCLTGQTAEVICLGCGWLGPPPSHPFVSCCPEREPVPVHSADGAKMLVWKEGRDAQVDVD